MSEHVESIYRYARRQGQLDEVGARQQVYAAGVRAGGALRVEDVQIDVEQVWTQYRIAGYAQPEARDELFLEGYERSRFQAAQEAYHASPSNRPRRNNWLG